MLIENTDICICIWGVWGDLSDGGGDVGDYGDDDDHDDGDDDGDVCDDDSLDDPTGPNYLAKQFACAP